MCIGVRMDFLAGISLSLVLFIVLVTLSKAKKSTNDVILLIWIFLLALPMVSVLLSEKLSAEIPLLSYSFPYPLLHGPMLWLYVAGLAGRNVLSETKSFVHLLPFIVGSTLKMLLVGSEDWPADVYINPTSAYNLMESLIFLTFAAYSVRILFLLNQCEQAYPEKFSVISASISFKWFYRLIFALVTLLIFPAIIHIFQISLWVPSYSLIFTGLIFILGYLSIVQSLVVSEHRAEQSQENQLDEDSWVSDISVGQGMILEFKSDVLPEDLESSKRKEKYERSGLTETKSCEYLARLTKYMEDEKPYLDARITVDALAHQLCISKNHLTQILSEKLDKNFYQYINEYRVDAFKKLVDDPDCHSKTLLALAYDSGFNSKSTFNTAFKKIEGVTPSQYRKTVFQHACA